jgi:hypothetical protein
MTRRTLVTRSTVAFATFALGIGCRDTPLAPTPPDLPAGAQALTPLPDYAEWWQATENCSGLHGNLSRITWFVMPGRTSFLYGDNQYDGYWWNGVHWILLAGDKVTNPFIVRHEMLHELLGRGDHPAKYFQQECAGVVACTETCRLDE